MSKTASYLTIMVQYRNYKVLCKSDCCLALLGAPMRHKVKLIRLLKTAYPNYSWQRWRFQNIRQDAAMGRELITDIAKQLNITTEADLDKWYRVSPALFGHTAHSVRFINAPLCKLEHQLIISLQRIMSAGGLHRLLCQVYPNHTWDPTLHTLSISKATQNSLLSTLQSYTPFSTPTPIVTL